MTTNYLDALGRAWKTTLPDGTSVTNNYDVTGLLTNTAGSRTYLECEFREHGSGTLLITGATPWPLLEGSHLSFGMSPAGFTLRFAFESDLLILKRKEGGEYLAATFERVDRFPGEREPK